MTKPVIEILDELDQKIDSFQNTESKDAWSLIILACEENDTVPEDKGRKISNGAIYFSIKDDAKVDAVVASLVSMSMKATRRAMKDVLLDRRAKRLSGKTS